ncbi:hypothetical protein VTI74DRAFT_678 [Chaetomium olivicolor]
MPPKERSTNFKTWETQNRLLCALVASLGPTKFDYKEIQKFFGASTADGLAFQFRGIKNGAKTLKEAVEAGQDPLVAFHEFLGRNGSGSVPATPSISATGAAKRSRATKTPASGATATPASKRRKSSKPEPELDDDEDSPEVDYSELDVTPTKPRSKITPRVNPAPVNSAWKKPTEPVPPRSRPIAPRPPTPSYPMAPAQTIAAPSHPGYHASSQMPPMSATPSATNSPALDMRRNSAFSSAGSNSFPNSPIPASADSLATSMTMSMSSQYPPVQAPAPNTLNTGGMPNNMGTVSQQSSFNMNPFESAASPSMSAGGSGSEVITPQTAASVPAPASRVSAAVANAWAALEMPYTGDNSVTGGASYGSGPGTVGNAAAATTGNAVVPTGDWRTDNNAFAAALGIDIDVYRKSRAKETNAGNTNGQTFDYDHVDFPEDDTWGDC